MMNQYIHLREAGTTYLKNVLLNNPDRETRTAVENELNNRQRSTFFNGTRHIEL